MGRIQDQRAWYASKADWNRKRATWFQVGLVAIELAAFAMAIFTAAYGLSVSVYSILAAFAVAGVGWLQIKQHRSMANAYSLASHDLAAINSTIDSVDGEDAWAGVCRSGRGRHLSGAYAVAGFSSEGYAVILGKDAIRERLKDGQIFKDGTWVEESIMEASYALRVASDGLLLGGKRYRPDKDSIEERIAIKPGEIAILSTIERLNMPGNLVGKLGIRFNYATQGLTGLMGIQVDPFFGWGHDDERLYIRVANLGNEAVPIDLGADVFTFELHEIQGECPCSFVS